MTTLTQEFFLRRDDDNIGSAVSDDDPSLSSVLSSLIPVCIFAAVWFLAFLILRSRFPRKYFPRAFLTSLPEQERTPQLPTGLFNWFGAFFKIPDAHVLNAHSLDGFLFLRLLKISVITCFVGCLITWPILFPVNITGGGNSTELGILTMGNVRNDLHRYYAHVLCAYLYFGFMIYMITRESIFYINLRQAYLMSPLYANRLSSKTVLFTAVPDEYLNTQKIQDVLGPGVVRVWLPTNTSDLEDIVEERDKVAMQLEAAETKLIRLANDARIKALKKDGRSFEEEQVGFNPGEGGSIATRWIKDSDRPTNRLKPIIGKKVDTINWARGELQRLVPAVNEEQLKHRNSDTELVNAVFVEFRNLSEAQSAFQCLTHHQVLHMAPRYTGLHPDEIIWSNLKIKWWERIIRVIFTNVLVVATIIFWSVPVAFVGSIAQINNLIDLLPWLGFLNNLPDVIFGVVTGLLPVIAIAVLMALLPIFLRLMARLGGDPTRSAVELTVQNSYFAFQIIQIFLVATLSQSAAKAVESVIDDPSSVLDILSESIPASSTFYLSYFVLQGLGVVFGLLLGIVGLIVFVLLGKLLDNTPRKKYNRWIQLSGLGWGTVFPIYTNLWAIAICYACVAPLVLGFACIGLLLFYMAYRYNLLFVYDAEIDTKGLVYPRALQQLFVGIYLAEITLIGLFAVQVNKDGVLGPFILMIILLVFTFLYHFSFNYALDPLLKYFPKSLEAEERRLLAQENGETALNHGSGDDYLPDPKSGQSATMAQSPRKKPNFLTKFLRPDLHADYKTMRELVPVTFSEVAYDAEFERDAYFHPAVRSEVPLLWIPRDPMGVSAEEIALTSKVIPITDEGASLDEKNRIVWLEEDAGNAPVAKPKILY